MSNFDHDAKIRLGYTDRNSFVRLDGSEVLYGKDWKRRKEELMVRSGGQCEELILSAKLPEYCKNFAEDPHHIVPKSEKRDDRLSNLRAVCRYHLSEPVCGGGLHIENGKLKAV